MTVTPPHRHITRPVFLPCAILVCVAVAAWGQDGATTKPKDAGPEFQKVVVIQLAIKDLDRSVKFYTETLGMKLDYRMDAMKWAQIRTPIAGLSLGLGQNTKVAGSGTASVNLAVADTDGVRKLLEKRGVKFSGATTEIPGVVRLADFVDPDGNRFRLAGPPTGKSTGKSL